MTKAFRFTVVKDIQTVGRVFRFKFLQADNQNAASPYNYGYVTVNAGFNYFKSF